MGYSVYDLFEEHLKSKKGYDEFLEAFKEAYNHNDIKASYLVCSLLKIIGEEDFIKGIHDVIMNSFEDYQDIFIIASKSNYDVRFMGDLPESITLKTISNNLIKRD